MGHLISCFELTTMINKNSSPVFMYAMINFIIFYLVGFCECESMEPPKQNYVLNFNSPIYVADEASKEYVDTSLIYVERYNETTVFMEGVAVLHKGLDKNTVLEVLLEKETSGKLEMMFSHEICDLCKEIEDPESNYQSYFKHFAVPKECPFGAGEYKIDKFMLETDYYPLSYRNAGKYQATLNFYMVNGEDYKSDKTLLCRLKMDLDIEPE